MPKTNETLPELSPIGGRIYTVRGKAVMLDSDLAEVYGVETKRINEAVKRNPERFEQPYSFQLLQNEWDALRSQIATLKIGRGGHRKYLPRVFTEHGAVMLSSVLNSERAIRAGRSVVDAFVRLRHLLDANRELARKVDELADQVGDHSKAIAVIFQELEAMAQGVNPEPPRERIGFKTNKERGISGKKNLPRK